MIDPDAFIHPLADVDPDATIGAGTRVWQFSVVLAGAVVGRDCNLNAHTFVEGGATIGDRVTLKCGVFVWDGIALDDDVFVGPNACFTNDPYPRSRRRPAMFARTSVGSGASIGAGAVILPGLTIGAGAMIGAGAVVVASVDDRDVVVGNPARSIRNGD